MADIKDLFIWLIVIVIAFAAIDMFKKQSSNYTVGSALTEDACETSQATKMENGAECAPQECVLITTNIKNCATGVSSIIGNNLIIGRYVGFVDWKEPCSDLTANGFEMYNCIYGDVIIPDGNCNTDADTDCNQLVSKTEVLSYISMWLDNKITKTEVLQGISAWLAG